MIELLLVGALIFGWVHFGGKMQQLEESIKRLEKQSVKMSSRPIPLADSQPLTAVPLAMAEETNFSEPVEDTVFDNFVDWVKQDFMVKLGAFLLLLALGWFVSYAFANNWIGPMGRITLGILTGVIFLIFGTLRMRRHVHQGGIFTLVGATAILLTLYAAREIYDFFTPETVLVLMFLVVSFVALVSVKFNSEKMAGAGLVMGAFAPLLTNASAPEVLVIFPYLLVLVIGTLWVVWRTGWTKLTLTALVLSYLHSLQFLFGWLADKDAAIMFAFLFVAIFFAANVVSLVRRRGQEQHLAVHTMTALMTAIFLFSWIETAAVDVWRSLFYSAWSLVFALGTYVVYLTTRNFKAFYLYGATSIALVGMATAAELSGPILVIAYLLEIALLVIAAGRLRVSSNILSHLSLILIIPIMLSFESLIQYNWTGVLNEHFAVVSLLAMILGAVGLFLQTTKDFTETAGAQIVSTALLLGSGFYVVSLIWLVNHQLFLEDLATMLSLIVYMVAGISMFIYGKIHSLQTLRIVGGVLIGLVIARLLMIEIWNMEITGRIITFLVIGMMLISTAFIQKLQPEESGQSANS